jgi:hypothetical protein
LRGVIVTSKPSIFPFLGGGREPWFCRATCLDYARWKVEEGVLGRGKYDVSDWRTVRPKEWNRWWDEDDRMDGRKRVVKIGEQVRETHTLVKGGCMLFGKMCQEGGIIT